MILLNADDGNDDDDADDDREIEKKEKMRLKPVLTYGYG